MNKHCKAIVWKIIDCGLTCCPRKVCVCHHLYLSQGCRSIDDFHIPEPWNGDIEHAQILFVSLNPGFTPNELYPNLGNPYWTQLALTSVVFDNGKVEDFFENRVNDYYVRWSTSQGKSQFSVRLTNGTYKDIPSQGYWNYVQSIADFILNHPAIPGQDYALTEVVHCKSRSTKVISKKCYDECMKKHFKDILNVASNLQYLVIIGAPTRSHVAKYLNHVNPAKYVWYDTPINGKMVKVIYADHNSGWGKNHGSVSRFPNPTKVTLISKKHP